MTEATRAAITGPGMEQLLGQLEAGRRPALARAISLVEDQRPGFRELLHALHPRVGRAHRVGITGPPGAGKSTLVAALVSAYRERDQSVAVIAVDPTSPFTGGALLGDRIRMNEIALDPGVFIRSMATRGSAGGLALTTEEVADVLDAAGFDQILIETVGVGQTELGIAAAADTTMVVLVPESGDGIQAMKAGLMEVADLFVVNKSDRPGADRMAREISQMLHLRAGRTLRNVPAHHGVDMKRAARAAAARSGDPAPKADGADGTPPGDVALTETPAGWDVPVLQTEAHLGKGVPELVDVLAKHLDWLVRSGERSKRRQARLRERVREEVERQVRRLVWDEAGGSDRLERALPDLESRVRSPYEVAAAIVQAIRDGSGFADGGR